MVVLAGQPVSPLYVFHQMLGEFAATLMALVNAVSDGLDDGDDNACHYSLVGIRIFIIINLSYPSIIPYYHECWDRVHKNFI
jgi:hypothetical protein